MAFGNVNVPGKLTAADVGAAAAGHTHTAAQVGAAASGHTHTAAQVGAVPISRKVNNKALSADITLSAADIGAAAAGHTHTAAQVGAAAANHTHTAAQVGADASGSAAAVQANLNSHAGNKSNPHGVTAARGSRSRLAQGQR